MFSVHYPVVPGGWKRADPGEEDRGFHVHSDTQTELSVVTVHLAWTAAVPETQHAL